MVTVANDPTEVIHPGELVEDDGWEEVIEQDCAACGQLCKPQLWGLCYRCTDRYVLDGAGCGPGTALRVVASLPGDGTIDGFALAHLALCTRCREFLAPLGEALRVAALDAEMADREAPHRTFSLAAVVR